ncbi:hypothetical protein BH09PSE1_BH09PSE1_04960 [soil metagenome]
MTAAPFNAEEPRVSVIVAARDVGDYIDETITSLQSQSLQDFEVLVVDDGSTDDTLEKLQAVVVADRRFRLFGGLGKGPAAARNVALHHARGLWIAILDGDDAILPSRLESLVVAGEQLGADLVADNLTAFYSDGRPDHPWLDGEAWSRPRTINIDDYLGIKTEAGSHTRLGYLKPLFRTQALKRLGLAYDESLFIGEDYDLVARCLLAGAVFHYMPEAGYRYRRHGASISYRITSAQLATMLAGMERLKAASPTVHHAIFDARVATLRADLAFVRKVEAIKRGSPVALIQTLLGAQTRPRLLDAVREGVQRRLGAAI